MDEEDVNKLLMYIDSLERYIERESRTDEIILYSAFNLLSLCVAFIIGYVAAAYEIDIFYRLVVLVFAFLIYLFTAIKFSKYIVDKRIVGEYGMYFQLFTQLKIDLLMNPENLNKEDVLKLLRLIKRKFDITKSTSDKIILIIKNS